MSTISERVANRDFSPEHYVGSVTELTPVIVDDCIYNGAAKVTDVFDPDLISDMNRRIAGYNSMWLRYSEIRTLGRFIRSQLQESGRVTASIDTDPLRHTIPKGGSIEYVFGHIDNHPKSQLPDLTGVSALIPLSGPSAVFGAQETRFNHRYEKSGPKLLWEYGLGDLMMVRQGIRRYKGLLVNKGPAYHFGFSSVGERKLLMIDFELTEPN